MKLFHFTTLTFFLSTIFVTQILAQTSPKSSLIGNGEVLYNIPQQKVDSPLGMISEGQVYGRVRRNTFVFSSPDTNGAYTTPVSAFISKGSNKSGDYRDALYIFSLLYLDEDTNKGLKDSMYYYGGIVKNLQSYPELQYRVQLGYRDFYNDAYSSKDYLDTRLEFNYLF
ncbi:MAG: hypothetical protein SPLUMA1_SPLUMAMAG1_00413 [uncultured Sulfurimonas sp.]|nr:MAG: hypothetical protein SPLUMA1_SPLUMAMAG1_00413 [uncultured Sulfurimonas sp.]